MKAINTGISIISILITIIIIILPAKKVYSEDFIHNKAIILIYQNTKNGIAPYIKVRWNGVHHVYHVLLDTGAYFNHINTSNLPDSILNETNAKLLQNKKLLVITVNNKYVPVNKVQYTQKTMQTNYESSLGLLFLRQFVSVVFTYNKLYLNYLPDGVKHCGKMLPGRKIEFNAKVDNEKKLIIFDSGTGSSFVKLGLIKNYPIKKLNGQFYFSSYFLTKKIPVQLNLMRHIRFYYAKGLKVFMTGWAMPNYNNNSYNYIFGWANVYNMPYYINNRLRQQCFLYQHKYVKRFGISPSAIIIPKRKK